MNIRELIHTMRKDRSYEDLAKSALSRQRWQQLAEDPIKEFPKPDTIRAIASTLGVTESTVVLALAESLGIPMTQSSRVAALLPAGVDRLSDAALRALLTLMRELVGTEPSPGAVTRMAEQAADKAHARPRLTKS